MSNCYHFCLVWFFNKSFATSVEVDQLSSFHDKDICTKHSIVSVGFVHGIWQDGWTTELLASHSGVYKGDRVCYWIIHIGCKYWLFSDLARCRKRMSDNLFYTLCHVVKDLTFEVLYIICHVCMNTFSCFVPLGCILHHTTIITINQWGVDFEERF